MRDQADRLRQLALQLRWRDKDKPASPVIKAENTETASEPGRQGPRVIAVTSGKGGVGKTNFTANLALALAEAGHRVVLMDADLGLANVDVLLGMVPRHTLKDVIEGTLSIREILTQGPLGISVIAGGSGVAELADLSEQQVNCFVQGIGELDQISDFILIDTGAGIGRAVLGFVLAAQEIVVLSTPEPTSITDAYATIKAICNRRTEADIRLVINRAASLNEAQEAYEKLSSATDRFLGVKVPLLGSIPDDPCVARAVMVQQPFYLRYPHAEVTLRLREIAQRLLLTDAKAVSSSGVSGFFTKVISLFR